MAQSNEESMKKISNVNLDKLIEDFSQIEKVCKDTYKWLQRNKKDFFQGEGTGKKGKFIFKKVTQVWRDCSVVRNTGCS